MFLTLPQQKVFSSPEFKRRIVQHILLESLLSHIFSEVTNQNHNKLSPYILKDDYYLKRKIISADKVAGRLEPSYTAVRI